MAELLHKLGRFASRRADVVLVAWGIILAIVVGGFAVGFKGLASGFDIPNTASGDVIDELTDELPDFAGASGTVVLQTQDGAAFTDAQRSAIADLLGGAADLVYVSAVTDPFDVEQQRADGAAEITDGRSQLDAGQEQLDAAAAQITDGRAQLDAAQQQLDAAREQATAAGFPTDQLDAQQGMLDAQGDELAAGEADLVDAQAELDANAAKLDEGADLLALSEQIRFVSTDESAALVTVQFTEPMLALPDSAKEAVVAYFEENAVAGVNIMPSSSVSQAVPEILGVGEVVGVLLAAVVLIVVLGSALAASFPIITAIVGVGVATLGSMAFSGVVSMSSVTPILGVMLGLAVGIDYALFIINRHRKQLLEGQDVHASIALANGTAGNAVVFAGATVIVALLALNITGIPFLGLMGTVGAIGVAVAVLLAVSLIPALLGMAGLKVLGRRGRAQRDAALAGGPASAATSASAVAVRPMRTGRAVLTTLGTIALLAILAIPSGQMRLGLPAGDSEPAGSAAYNAFTVTTESFGAGANSPLLVTAQVAGGLSEDKQVSMQLQIGQQLMALDDVVAVAPIAVSDDQRLFAFQVIPAEGPNAVSTEQLVHDLRALPSPDGVSTLGVAGQAAVNIDISSAIAGVLPLYLAVVVGLSFLIMVMVFRSLLVPLVATGGFVLSLFATYGVLTAVFQWGWAADLFGVHTPGPLLSFMPVLLVGILFGLAMDYQLFLATGMREAFVHGSPARLAVAQGFRAGRRVVIAAALIMVAVFAGFVTSESVMIKTIGLGLAVGVLLDAFIVRLLMMPAIMHLLGKSAWWLPRWLDRIIPNVDVEGANLERRHPAEHADVQPSDDTSPTRS